jgi:Uma2 family endonuclease
MTIRLDQWNRTEPDVLVTTSPYDPDRTFYTPDEVLLVVEVVSPESAHRDRMVKVHKYAEAGIAHYWRVEDEGGRPVVHAYELNGPTGDGRGSAGSGRSEPHGRAIGGHGDRRPGHPRRRR